MCDFLFSVFEFDPVYNSFETAQGLYLVENMKKLTIVNVNEALKV